MSDSVKVKDRLLMAAEALFGERGFAGVGVRALTERAEVNVAAVNYHFGSKEELYLAMVRRRVEPVNAERLRRLEALSRADADLTVEAILAALVEPVLNLLSDGEGKLDPIRMRLAGRVFWDLPAVVNDYQERLFGEVRAAFFEAFRRALPELSPELVQTRLGFVVALFGGTFVKLSKQFEAHSETMTTETVANAFRRMIEFAAAGMVAPVGGEP